MIAISQIMAAVQRRALKLAATRYPLVLLGPTGVGKGMLARLIHRASSMSGGPFFSLSGGELTPTLYHNQLFGSVRGAFSGSVQNAKGAFEQAAHGTLFLDEMHCWIPDVQNAMLRVLGDLEYMPISGARAVPVSCRLLFAANRPLEELMNEGALLPDLGYRIGDLAVLIPPLAQRREDIVPLAYHFLEVTGKEIPLHPQVRFAPKALWQLVMQEWKGNVRELANVVRASAVDVGDGVFIELENLPEKIREPQVRLEMVDDSVRHEIIGWAFRYCHQKRKRAADLLGVHDNTIDYHTRGPRSRPAEKGGQAAG